MEINKTNKTISNNQNNNNNTNNQIDFSDTQRVVQLMKEQNKELKLNKKKLEKLEEKFVQVNTDLKNIINDKANIEDFISNIFPKDMLNQVIKKEYGTYDKSELSKLWLIAESKNQSEYNNILTRLKSEINDLNMKNKELSLNYNQITSEYDEYKKNNYDSTEQLTQMINENKELKENVENLTNEKTFLMKILDEKNAEIQILNNLELENAELKAKSLLNTLNNNEDVNDLNMYNLSLDDNYKEEKEKNINNNEKNHNNNNVIVKIDSLNMGTQTDNIVYNEEEYQKLKDEIEKYKNEINELKQEFNDYKIKSNKVLLTNENNYNKVFKEYEKVKKELSQLLSKHNNQKNEIHNHDKNLQNLINIQPASVGIDRKNFKNFDVNQRVSKEYLKNVLLKYLEAIAIGNEFETKILENVLFTVLQVSKNEINYLEDKRITSSFYYNLWYNAKAFLSSKIYGDKKDIKEKDKEEKNGNGSIVDERKDNKIIDNNIKQEPINI